MRIASAAMELEALTKQCVCDSPDGESEEWKIGPCPHCGHKGFSRPYGMNPEIYECNKCKGTWHRGWKP